MEQALNSEAAAILRTKSGAAGLSLEDFDALVAGMQTRVYRILLGLLRDPEAAESLTQDCFLRVYQGRSTYRGQASLSTWVIQIAINLARDHQRNRKAQFWRGLFAGGDQYEAAAAAVKDARPSHESALVAREQVEAVWRAAEELPTQQRAVFLLRFVEDRSLEEIAAATGLKVGTVKIHLFRAVRAVRNKVKSGVGAKP